jgi:serine/threonine protein kinase
MARQVNKLVDAHFAAGTFLDQRAGGAARRLPQLSEQAGSIIDRYRLVQEIGVGGFGVVFLAEQSQPIQRTVAVKIIKPGMDSLEVIARFEAERQALAMMDHPNIARVLDAGTTGSGRPYFVMELIRGIPITRFCDEQRLSTRERLELFQTVCTAVQHAHQKGIIHRDLKPSNILVSVQDGRPQAKIIDFGVSKALDRAISQRAYFTQYGQLIGTPQYMSPEQADMNDSDVDTRSDIYSLGVLLYELLTGQPPFDAKTLRQGGFDQMRMIIRQAEPPKPSTQIESLDNDSASRVAVRRRAQTRALCKLIAGDLDWIVMKALEKDRDRRYPTASGLADDIQRHLSNEPISAHPPRLADRLRKLAKRHKAAAGSLAAVAMVVLLALIGTSCAAYIAWMQYASAASHYQELLEANARLRASQSKLGEQAEQLAELYRMRDLQAAGRLFLDAQRADVLSTKEVLYEQARALFEQHDDKRGQAACLRGLSMELERAWDYGKAVAAFEQALALYESAPDEFIGDDRPGWNAHNLAKLYHELGDYDRETELLEKLLHCHQHTQAAKNANVMFGLVRYAVHLDELGQPEQARPVWEQVHELYADALEVVDPSMLHRPAADAAYGEAILSDIQFRRRNPADARDVLESCAGLPLTGTFFAHTLAKAHALAGNTTRALQVYQDACHHDWRGELHAGSENLRKALTSDRLHFQLLKRLEMQEELEAALRQSILRRDDCLPANHPQQAFVRQQLADVLASTERHQEAMRFLLEAKEILDAQPLTPAVRLAELDQQISSVQDALGETTVASSD